jgi:ABC-2 type transport system ATP-binding protein
MTGDTCALEATALSKRYGNHWALLDCSLQLPAGRVAGLVGPNGAGKTTLLHLAMGLLEPTRGAVRVLGYSPRAQVHEALSRVGFVAQNRPLYKNFTVAQLLHFGAKLNRRWDETRARERLEQYAIPLNRKAGALSGGQQAQISLALALAKRPDLLLLDEPMSNLDPLARQEFLRTMLGAAAEEGTTVLFSSHVVSELGRFCDYLIILTQGRVRLAGDVDDLLATHKRLSARRDSQRGQDGLAPDTEAPGVIAVTKTEHETSMLVRTDIAQGIVGRIGWEETPVGLEDLVVSYMARPIAGPSPTAARLEKSLRDLQQA